MINSVERLVQTRWGWWIFALAAAAFMWWTIAVSEQGLGSSPQLANSVPGPELRMRVDASSSTLSSVVMTLALVAILAALSFKQKRLHRYAIVMMGAFFTAIVDPLGNWATFAIFDPNLAHYPTSWPYINWAPLTEPIGSFIGGYASSYLLEAMVVFWVTMHLLPKRNMPTTWDDKRGLVRFYCLAYAVSIPFNLFVQFEWLKSGIFTYTQAVGPIFYIDGIHLPLLVCFYDPFLFAMIALLFCGNAQGDSVVLSALAPRLPFGPSGKQGRQVWLAALLLIAAAMVPISILGALRMTGVAQASYGQFPYPEAKIYDPYGALERSGRAGPFYR